MMSKKGQIWVETVVYILIGLIIISIVLSILTPKIKEWKDKTILEETLKSLDDLNFLILDTRFAAGNVRTGNLGINKGKLIINASSDTITYILEGSNFVFSEIGEPTNFGEIQILTEKVKGNINVKFWITYDVFNITYEGDDEKVEILQHSPSPYKLKIENKGVLSNKTIIDIERLD